MEGVEDTLPPGFCHQAPPPPHFQHACPTQVALKEQCCSLLLFVVLPFCKRNKMVRNGAQKRMACWPHMVPFGPHGRNRAASRRKSGGTICYIQNSSRAKILPHNPSQHRTSRKPPRRVQDYAVSCMWFPLLAWVNHQRIDSVKPFQSCRTVTFCR